MKITGIETVPYAIPYTKPLKFASGARPDLDVCRALRETPGDETELYACGHLCSSSAAFRTVPRCLGGPY
ncbi:hypothetical protein [Streptomyces sp. GbtcB6]|uniref:hypothetical protein n=1 Tax=Streptomyces sp. GbtcB6 TaxID=2824751 RepID=UPI001C2FF73E|nr:hypothetical protein [Streptomyces sp. GbtcB6]